MFYWTLFGLVFGFRQIDLILVQYDLDICGDKSVLFSKAVEQVTGFTVLSNGSISWFTSTYFCTSKHNNSMHIKDGDADGGCWFWFGNVCDAKRFVRFYFVLLLLALDLFHTNDKNCSLFICTWYSWMAFCYCHIWKSIQQQIRLLHTLTLSLVKNSPKQ